MSNAPSATDYREYADPELLEELYHDEGKSLEEIADTLGCSPATVRRWMVRHDIPRRDPQVRRTGSDVPTVASIPLGRDPYRFACPRGHTALTKRRPNRRTGADRRETASDGEYLCQTCRQNGADDPYWHTTDIVDKKQVAQDDDGGWCGP